MFFIPRRTLVPGIGPARSAVFPSHEPGCVRAAACAVCDRWSARVQELRGQLEAMEHLCCVCAAACVVCDRWSARV